MKLLIAIPSNRDWKSQFGMSLTRLVIHLLSIKKIEVEIIPMSGQSCLSGGRQSLLDAAVNNNFTHILFIDDDMGFSVDAFDFLISRDKDFVAANCVTKKSAQPVTLGKNKETIYSAGKAGVERIVYTGLAFALIKTEAIKNIPRPHFEVRWYEELKGYLTEDYNFCYLLAKHGKELYIDHDAARHVVHIGDHGYQENFT